MTTILRIDASARTASSVSRDLGDHVLAGIRDTLPNSRLVLRDLAAAPLPHIASTTIAGYFTPDENMTVEMRQATVLSDELIAELKAADILVLTVPMYNFSIPSALKAWIDQVARIGHTFSYDGTQFAGMLGGRKAYVACAYGAGGYAPDHPFAAANFVEPYLRFLFGFLGIADITFYSIETTNGGEAILAANAAAAKRNVDFSLKAA